MGDDFYGALRTVDSIVHREVDPERLDGVAQREELDRALSAVALSARKLSDELRSYPPPENTGLLFDGYEGEWEERAYVPVQMAATPKAAKRAILAEAREYACEEPGFYLHCDRRAYLAPGEYNHGDEDWRYMPCRKHDAGAVEFWLVEIAERRISLRRGMGNVPRAARLYRHKRGKGEGRLQAAALSFRLYLAPQWARSLHRRVTVLAGGKDQ